MLYLALLLLLLAGLYAVLLLVLRTGLRHLKPGTSPARPNVSVIVPARNEQDTIATCLNAILNQSYPPEKVEIVVIDDRSEDRTAEIVAGLAQGHPQIRLLQIRDAVANLAPKKRALDLGIRNASGEIIVTTDADCVPGPLWLAELIRTFEPEVGMVAGFNPYDVGNSSKSLLRKILAIDYFAMACVAAASTGLNYPISCSGGNLAYRRKLYFEVQGFKEIGGWISGDDDFFLEQVRERTSWKVKYAIVPESFVPTQPPKTLAELAQQRIRYASKGRHYKRPVSLTLTAVYFLNLLLVVTLPFGLFADKIRLIWLGAFGLKTLAESIFLQKGAQLFRYRFSAAAFVLTALCHPVYLTVFGFLGQFAQFKWKGQKHTARMAPKKQEHACTTK